MMDHLFAILFFGRQAQTETEVQCLGAIYAAGMVTGAYVTGPPPGQPDPDLSMQEWAEDYAERQDFRARVGRYPASDYGWGVEDDTETSDGD